MGVRLLLGALIKNARGIFCGFFYQNNTLSQTGVKLLRNILQAASRQRLIIMPGRLLRALFSKLRVYPAYEAGVTVIFRCYRRRDTAALIFRPCWSQFPESRACYIFWRRRNPSCRIYNRIFRVPLSRFPPGGESSSLSAFQENLRRLRKSF